MMKKNVIGSVDMTVSEMINRAIEVKKMQKKEVARQMGWSPANFTNRLRNGTIDAEAWIRLCSILGYELQMVDMENGSVLHQRKPSSGPRVVQTIEGYMYDTDKAESICKSPKVSGGWFELFKDAKTGRFFTVAYLEPGDSACMALISKENARQFYQNCGGEYENFYFND